MSNETTNPYTDAMNEALHQTPNRTESPHDALSAAVQNQPAPLHYRLDRTDAPLIFSQPRGEDSLIDQFRDKLEASQHVATDALARVAQIHADRDLSAEGQAKQTAMVYREAMAALAPIAAELDKQESMIRAEVLEPLPPVADYTAGDSATPLVDLAVVNAFRDLPQAERMQMIARMLSGQEQRIADAVLRSPSILTGLSATVLQNMRDAARQRLHPGAMERRAKLEHASHASREMLSRAVRKIGTAGRLSLAEQRELLGTQAAHFPWLY